MSTELINTNQLVIDEYYSNGFSSVKAVQKYYPELSDSVARVKIYKILRSPKHHDYIETLKARLRASADISREQLVTEAVNIAFSDITTVAGLTIAEIKELPAEVRRCISSIKRTEHYDKQGNYAGETIDLKMKDSLKAMDMLNKYTDLYNADNRSKGNNINILQVLKDTNPDALNAIEQAMRNNAKE